VALAAEVNLLEPLGAETLVTLQMGSARLVARCPASFHDKPGTRVQVFVSPAHLHLFDKSTGAAI